MFTPNAEADFETEVTVTEEDQWGDPVETTEWQTALEGVPVRFTPEQVQDRDPGGDHTRRPAELRAPMTVDDEGHSSGDRVTIRFRGGERTFRMVEYGAVSHFGSAGHVRADLADWGDDYDDE